MSSTPLDDIVDVIEAVACTTYALFCVSKLALLKTMYRDSGQFILHCISLFKDKAVSKLLNCVQCCEKIV